MGTRKCGQGWWRRSSGCKYHGKNAEATESTSNKEPTAELRPQPQDMKAAVDIVIATDEAWNSCNESLQGTGQGTNHVEASEVLSPRPEDMKVAAKLLIAAGEADDRSLSAVMTCLLIIRCKAGNIKDKEAPMVEEFGGWCGDKTKLVDILEKTKQYCNTSARQAWCS